MTAPENTVNIPLLRKCVEWAEAEAAKPPELCEWNQAYVRIDAARIGRSCGTCYCIAGYVAGLESETGDPYDVPGFDPTRFAAERLGIPYDEDAWHPLFHASNTIEDVRRIAEDIAGERL